MIRKATLGILIALGVALAAPAAFADELAEARTHYQKGQALFAEGDYQAAVYEFEAAERLAPSPFNDYNIALSYEKMGNRVSALRHYQSYLKRMPNARNRGEVEGKIGRLQGELRAEAEKAEARRADEARAAAARQDEARKAEEQRKAEEARRAAEAAKPAEEPAGPAPGGAIEGGVIGGEPTPPPAAAAPAPPAPARRAPPPSTGDPELDRVAAIDVGAVRDQRQQALGSSQASFGDSGGAPRGGAEPAPVPADQPQEESKPAYKKWWFWVVVGVSAVILIDIMSTDSQPDARPAATGVTVFSF